jgi:prophage regulatory protein
MKSHNPKLDRFLPKGIIPEKPFYRLKQIIGDPKAKPPIPAIIPVSKSTWWEGVATGRYPRPVRLAARAVAWRDTDIRALIEKLGEEEG